MHVRPSHMPPIRTGNKMDDEKRAKEAEHDVVTYTFLSEMEPPLNETKPFDLNSGAEHDNTTPLTPQRTSHGKRRDASYIPRPPNAFILFRSSFIRDHKVTSKVEGNHSNLSKIIGMYWRTLTKEQRNEWEAKAEQALIEHRKRYPDWRFRPATNATVQPKTKIKDGARRGRARKDPPDRAGKEESKESPGKGRTMTRAEEEDSRLTKIAGLLVEGQEGEALERAVEEWEAERQKSRRSVSVSTPKSASSSPVMPRASASTDRKTTPLTLTLTLDMNPPPLMSASCSPILSRAHASSSMGPDPLASETPALSPSLSVSMSASSSPIITRESTTERELCLPFLDTSTPKHTPRSPPSTPRLSASASLNPPPSSSPATPKSRTSAISRPLLWPPSPGTPRTPISFPVFPQAEDWGRDQSPTRSTYASAPSSPVVTRASASTMNNGELSRFMTRASSSMVPELPTPPPTSTLSPSLSMSIDWEIAQSPARSMSIPASAPSSPVTARASASTVNDRDLSTFMMRGSMDPELPTPSLTSASELSPSLSMSMSMSTSSSRASTLEREPEPSSLSLAPSLSRIDTSTPSPSSPSTPHSSMLNSSPSVPMAIPKWLASPITPRTLASTPTTTPPATWSTSPFTSRIPMSFPASTRAGEWEVGLRVGRSSSSSMFKSALSSPVITRASALTTNGNASGLSFVPAQSPSCVYAPSTPKDILTPSVPPSTPISTSTPPVPIPKPSPSWHASPTIPYAAPTSVPWAASPAMPRISTSFPASTRAEDWEMGNRAVRSNSTSTSGPVSVLSSPVSIRPSTSTVGPAVLNRASRPPIMTRTPVLTPSWPPSPVTTHASASVLRSPIMVKTHVPATPAPTPSWSNVPTSPSTPHVSGSTPASASTSTSSRRSRPRSRSPTFKSPQNPNAPMSMKRSLSAPAPKREHHRQQQQEPLRMDTGFWWPVPREQECSSSRESDQQQQETMGLEMEMAAPTREGSFDASESRNQETENDHRETNEWGWNWAGCDESVSISKPTPTYPSITSPFAPTNPRYQREPMSSERWFHPWDVDTSVHAGESLHPPPPTPISPSSPSFSTLVHTPVRAPRSSFSSLAGWDGTSTEPAHTDASEACVVVKATMTGIGGMMWGGGGLQRLGVQGGGYGEDSQ
ncbi:hypothetical protein E4T56_gene11313 [Termitomyces sp. T112]|nr:hypothetical protein E4T56_gene11313 [Termitomyces sp. T112]